MKLILTDSASSELFGSKCLSISRTYFNDTVDKVKELLTEDVVSKILKAANKKEAEKKGGADKPRFNLDKDVYVRVVSEDKSVSVKIFQDTADTEKQTNGRSR